MAKTKISEWSTTPASNTDIDGINIAEGCAPSGINDAIRDLMAQVRSWQSGASGDPFNGPMNGTIGATTAYSGAFTTLSASGTTTLSGLTASTALALDASKNVVSVANTGSGSNVLATSPTLVTPALGTPSSATLTNATGLPISTGVSGLGTGVATALAVNVGSAGAPVVNGGALGTPSSGTATNLTGLPLSTGVTGTLPTANGGTGLTSFTSGGVVYASSTSALATGSLLTFDGSRLGVGTSSPSTYGKLAVVGGNGTGSTIIASYGGTSAGDYGLLVLGTGTTAKASMNVDSANNNVRFDTRGNTGDFYWASGASYTEQMRLTSTGLGIGTSSPAYKLDVTGNGNFTSLLTLAKGSSSGLTIGDVATNSNSVLRMQGTSAGYNWQIANNLNAAGLEFTPSTATGGTTYTTPSMTLTTTGLGIGTSSPAAPLSFAASTGQKIRFFNSVTGYGIGVESSEFRFVTDSSASFTWRNGTYSGGTTYMTLDASGNLGLGVTPSAWRTGYSDKVFQIGARAALVSDSNLTTDLGNNWYLVGSDYKYLATDAASRYQQYQGLHKWFTAASGTAGTAITFTQAMTLDASGNLGVGTTTPDVFSRGYGTTIGVSNTGVNGTSIAINSGTSAYPALELGRGGVRKAIFTASSTVTEFGNLEAVPLAFITNSTERARIDSSGNFGIGTSSPATTLHVKSAVNDSTNGLTLEYNAGTAYYQRLYSSGNDLFISADTGNTGGTMRFSTGGTERARITSGGYFKASDSGNYQNSTGSSHEFSSTAADNLIKFRNTNANPYGADMYYSGAAPNGTGNAFLYCQDNAAVRATIRSNGGIANYSANDVNLSDRREKTNFAPAGEYLGKICAIPVQTFNYIDQNLEEDGGLTLGVVAQDVQAVAPELVMESNWGTEENPKMRLSIYQTDLQYALMKCIQEQQAIIEQLTARVAQLESN